MIVGLTGNIAAGKSLVTALFRGWGARATVTRPLRDGADLELRDRTLRVRSQSVSPPR